MFFGGMVDFLNIFHVSWMRKGGHYKYVYEKSETFLHS